MHFYELPKKRVKKTQETQHHLACSHIARTPLVSQPRKLKLSRDTGAPKVPRLPERRWSVQEVGHDRTNVRDEHELVRFVDGTDEFGLPVLLYCEEEIVEQASLDARAVEIRESQDRRSNFSRVVRSENNVLLFLALFSLERVRLPWVFLGHARALGPAKNVQRSDQEQAVDLLRDRGIHDATHQDGVQLKVRVWDTNHVHDSTDAPERISDGLLVIRIPDGDFRERITTERLFQNGARPTDHPVRSAFLAQRRRHALADRSRGANESYRILGFLAHGSLPFTSVLCLMSS